MTSLVAQRLGAVFGLLGVVLGAFAAHGLKPLLMTNGTWEIWHTAVFYQFVHALALLVVGQKSDVSRGVIICWSAGVFFFSGSLYLLAAFPDQHWLGPVTPLGGTLMIAGWGWLLWSLRAKPNP